MFLQRVKAPEGPRRGPRNMKQKKNETKKKQFYVFKFSEEIDMREVVQAVANGLDASQIQPTLYPQLYPLLSQQKSMLKKINPCSAVSIGNAMKYIECWKPDKLSSDENDFSDEYDGEDVYLPSADMINEGIKKAMSKDASQLRDVDPQLFQYLIGPLREIRRKALDADDYKKAEKADIGARKVVAQIQLQQKMEEMDEKTNIHNQKKEIAEIQLENIKEKWSILIDQRRQMMNDDLLNKQNEFNEKLAIFDEQFQNEPPPNKMKSSPQLLDLRAREKFLVSSKRFDDAKKLRQFAILFEQKEKKQKKEEFYNELSKEREKMIQIEKKKMFLCEMNWQNTISNMQAMANKEIQNAEKSVDHKKLIQLKNDININNNDDDFMNDKAKSSKNLPPLRISGGGQIISKMNTVR